MLEIFEFYLKIVLKVFNDILQKFQVADGIGFGTFLLACSLFVIFINLLKFQFGTDGVAEIKAYSNKRKLEKAKHISKGKHGK